MIKNLINMRFGRLLVISREPSSKDGRAMWLCECDCGKKCVVKGKYLLNGDTKSCGCLNIDRIRQTGKNNINPNEIKIKDNMVCVYFKNSEDYFICDLDDLKAVKQTTWHKNNSGYARGNVNGKLRLFHNLLFNNKPKDKCIDHINGNRLDNRRCNLRIVNSHQNNLNRKIHSNNTSGYTGIYKCKSGKWGALITYNYQTHWLGCFDDFNKALVRRKEAEIEYFGEYRRNAS